MGKSLGANELNHECASLCWQDFVWL